ncbi:MAG: TIR domain-containing protein [Defluviitaleaceae bacterium]|nr:TIR domain-containing protein [Defluviitaleaceae bacterium]
MAIFKCKMCGGDIHAEAGAAFGTCDSCQTTSTLPKANEERIVNLFNRANHFRRLNEFDKALTAYENILGEDSNNAEAHWGVVLCRYGIEYVEDPKTGKRVPTCHRAQYASILADADYLAALDNAPDGYAKGLYEEEAKIISEIQKGILAIANNEEPFDVFICYKESTDGGSRTVDSTLAQDIYYQLTNDGFKVFFSRITLEDRLGREYEPYIFNALNTAKVMLVIGTKKEHFEAVWVKNEWSRFLALMKNDRSRLLIPCYRDMDAYDMPDELAPLQSQDMSKIGFIQDLIRGVKKVLEASTSAAAQAPATSATAAPGVESLMKRGWLFLEDADWKQADEYFDKVLDIDPEHAPAYIGKLCCELNINNEDQLANHLSALEKITVYQKALRFAKGNYRTKIEGHNLAIKEKEALLQAKLKLVRERIAKFQGLLIAGFSNTIGLKSNGTVVATGIDTGEWRGIVAIYAGFNHLVGLKADGTVVAAGENDYGQCDTGEWRDIVAVFTGPIHTVGLKADGTVVAVGLNFDKRGNTDEWRDIVAVFTGPIHTVGLKADGTVVAVGKNDYGQCDIGEWLDIVAISTGSNHTVGLKADGTVVAVGKNEDGQCNISEWRDIVPLSEEQVLALKQEDERNKEEERRKHEKEQEEKLKREEQVAKWRKQGLCTNCGGQVGGLFTKKCKSCGKVQIR